jgi:hypothetical protein
MSKDRIPQRIWDQISTKQSNTKLCEQYCQYLVKLNTNKKMGQNRSSNQGRCSKDGSTVYWGTSLCLHKK